MVPRLPELPLFYTYVANVVLLGSSRAFQLRERGMDPLTISPQLKQQEGLIILSLRIHRTRNHSISIAPTPTQLTTL